MPPDRVGGIMGRPNREERAMTTRTRFARELNWLIRKHCASLRYGDDFIDIITTLHQMADKLAVTADGHPWRDDDDVQGAVGKAQRKPAKT
jgi:hypothetical protein